MNSWSEYELLFDILMISLNVLWYAAIVIWVIEKILDVRKVKGEQNDNTWEDKRKLQ